ncbi:MAG: CRISPR-associated protein Csn1 [Flavobacteriaceae bacterium]|nr:CRISPR-associated protein Csn1 [Flavobacteriaceae bacterium]
MKTILGLDLGTNSIGWANIKINFEKKEGEIINIGSRIIPMGDYATSKTGGSSKDPLADFSRGVGLSKTKIKTQHRSTRNLYQKDNLRRERLHRVLNILDFLPKHYAESIDFTKKLGQFKKGKEIKLNYRPVENGKDQFIFMDSFLEMVAEFKIAQPQLFYQKANGNETKIPYDWTLYYLRKKSLTQKISKEELAWLLLNFNQKRGYYQLRGEEQENDTKQEEFHSLKVINVEATEDKNAKGIWYNVILENNLIYRRQSKEPLSSWIGQQKEFIITTNLEKDGFPKKDKEGNIKRSFRAVDSEKDWIAIKKKTEQDIAQSKKTVGTFIYDTLLQNPSQKINGKLVKTIERKLYKKELNLILETQLAKHNELTDSNSYNACIEELYPRNEAHLNTLKEKSFLHLFMEDIIFYQRPLKSKKSTISNCAYESRTYYLKNKETKVREKITEGLKVISKSNPLFNEFRLWQFLKNLKIYQLQDEKDIEITSQCIGNDEDWCNLFDFLNKRKEVEQKHIIDFLIKEGKLSKKEKPNYRWNYPEDKKYPINETRSQFLRRLAKVEQIDPLQFLTKEKEYALWHLIYSVKDKKEYEQALHTFARKNNLDIVSFVTAFLKHPPYSADYGSYSEKAIKKLLPLMRMGKYWEEKELDTVVKNRILSIFERIEHINLDKTPSSRDEETALKEAIIAVADDDIPKQLIKSFLNLSKSDALKGLNTYQACYAVYERHAEVSEITQWKTPKDIDFYLSNFKQHSLRNPIVEQVVTETLRTVRDIWQQSLEKDPRFKFDEIHVELGRDMKNSAEKRKRISERQTSNENTNARIKLLLEELKNDYTSVDIRPYSPSHQEILKIYEEGVAQNPLVSYAKLNEDEILKIRKNAKPTSNEIKKYKLWLEQNYISPYTGNPIPLSKLFTHAYEIEHIIPQSRFFDDSLNNKIICESDINRDKSNRTAYEYLKDKGGSKIEGFDLLTLSAYENHCNKYFKKNRTKLKNLLSEEVPEGFIQRQMNDSRYISKLIKGLLSNIVREEGEKEATAKNLLPVNGAVTSRLKQDWGLNEQWNEIIRPRFERMNEISNSQDYGYMDSVKDVDGKPTGKKFFRLIAPEGLNKKRIDHRHHTLDAIIIACCTRKHIQYLNALNNDKVKYALQDSLRNSKEIQAKNKKGVLVTKTVATDYKKPWANFPVVVKNALEKVIVSFKQNTRVINKTNNKTWQWVSDKDGKLQKKRVKQTKGDNWAIRKPLHKETVYGSVRIKKEKKGVSSLTLYLDKPELIIDKKIRKKVKALNSLFDKDKKKIASYLKNNTFEINGEKIDKIKVWEWTKNATATRTVLSEKLTRKQLDAITDSGIQQILEQHLKNYHDENNKERLDLAFNIEGLDVMNKNITQLNNGKKHQPIKSVRIYEDGSRFTVSQKENKGNKTTKYVEAATGTNLFFAIYWNIEKKQRVYETIPLHEVIEWQKQRAENKEYQLPLIPINHSKGEFLFYLSPNDLVYVPTEEEINNPTLVNIKNISKEQAGRIYKMVSSTGNECHFINDRVSSLIKKYDTKSKTGEYGSLNKSEKTINKILIKKTCWKLQLDRIGNIKNAITCSNAPSI